MLSWDTSVLNGQVRPFLPPPGGRTLVNYVPGRKELLADLNHITEMEIASVSILWEENQMKARTVYFVWHRRIPEKTKKVRLNAGLGTSSSLSSSSTIIIISYSIIIIFFFFFVMVVAKFLIVNFPSNKLLFSGQGTAVLHSRGS